MDNGRTDLDGLFSLYTIMLMHSNYSMLRSKFDPIDGIRPFGVTRAIAYGEDSRISSSDVDLTSFAKQLQEYGDDNTIGEESALQ